MVGNNAGEREREGREVGRENRHGWSEQMRVAGYGEGFAGDGSSHVT